MQALFYPGSPHRRRYTVNDLFEHLGYTVTVDPRDAFDFAVSWLNRTWVPSYAVLEEVARKKPVLNLRCTDISKEYVDTLFRDVFGYSAAIDPTTYTGRAVRKPNANAWGKGVFVDCPIRKINKWFADGSIGKIKKRYVYQQFIDTSQDDGLIAEYRTPVVLGTIPMVYILYKEMPDRVIKTQRQGVQFVETADVFTPEECNRIVQFCRCIGLDLGELDILRSNEDGRLNILDANKTPGGLPVGGLTPQARVVQLAEALEKGLHALLHARP